MQWSLLGLAVLGTVVLVRGVPDVTRVVHTRYGAVRGTRTTLSDHSYVDKFLAIPYAEAPVGNLRFREPVTVSAWNGTRDCTQYGPMCPQRPDGYLLPSQIFPQSEDCLFLNVYTPKVADASTRLPVMVWLHGGGFRVGSGSRFDWTRLAEMGVVVVTPNYRLDALGFLSTEDSASPGNFGLLDQIKALEWVRDVIPSFHGDPSNVTIFGESAGGASVSLLVLSRKAKGLFHKAIMESGASLNSFSMMYPKTSLEPKTLAMELGRRLGCDVSDASNTAGLVACLRLQSPEDIVHASQQLDGSFRFKPIAETLFGQDDGVFGDTPFNILSHSEFSDVPTIRGFNHDESSIGLNDPNNNGFTMAQFRQLADNSIRPFLEYFPFNLDVDGIISQAIDNYVITPNITDPQMIRQAFLQMDTDFVFIAPILMETRLAVEHSTQPQYVYQFVYRSAERLTPAWKGVMHTDEIAYVSGAPVHNIQPFPNYVSNWTDDDIRISREVMTMWTNFAKFGNPTPTPVEGKTWQPWTSSDARLLEIGSSLSMIDNPMTPQQQFWFRIYSQIYSTNTDSLIG